MTCSCAAVTSNCRGLPLPRSFKKRKGSKEGSKRRCCRGNRDALEEGLFVKRRCRKQVLIPNLFIGRMLIHNEQIGTKLRDDKTVIELPNDTHPLERPLQKGRPHSSSSTTSQEAKEMSKNLEESQASDNLTLERTRVSSASATPDSAASTPAAELTRGREDDLRNPDDSFVSRAPR